MKKLIAFTLAEVIIVMGIIGIVAEITIPGLANETQKSQGLAGLKKSYTTWNQALVSMAGDVGCPSDLSCFFDSDDITTIGNKITPYFKIAKNCKITTDMDCWTKYWSSNINGKGKAKSDINTNPIWYKFQTKDGMSYAFTGIGKDCAWDYSGIQGANLSKICMSDLYIDINGPKSPNTMGRDIFYFFVTTGHSPSLYPWGGAESSVEYWKTNNHCTTTDLDGTYCAARIIEEGWQMKY